MCRSRRYAQPRPLPPSLRTAAGPPRHCPLAYSPTQPRCGAARGAELTRAARIVAQGGSLVAQAVYPWKGMPSHLKIYKVASDMADQTGEVLTTIATGEGGGYKHTGNIIRTLWSKTNQHVLTCSDDCTIRKWDVETGKMVGIVDEDHTKPINDIQLSDCGTHFISSSSDHTAKLFDFHGLDSAPPGRMALKTYRTGANVNSASISPCLDHVLVAGGQDAADVTTTGAGQG